MNHTCARICGLMIPFKTQVNPVNPVNPAQHSNDRCLCLGAVGKKNRWGQEHRNVLAGFAFVNFVSPLVAWQMAFEIAKRQHRRGGLKHFPLGQLFGTLVFNAELVTVLNNDVFTLYSPHLTSWKLIQSK